MVPLHQPPPPRFLSSFYNVASGTDFSAELSCNHNAPMRMAYILDGNPIPQPFSRSPYDPTSQDSTFDLPGQNVPVNKTDSSSLSVPQTSPNDLMFPGSTFGVVSPTPLEDGSFSLPLDRALGFVPQVEGNYSNQSFVGSSSYWWGNVEWRDVDRAGCSDGYPLNSIPAVELSIPGYGELLTGMFNYTTWS